MAHLRIELSRLLDGHHTLTTQLNTDILMTGLLEPSMSIFPRLHFSAHMPTHVEAGLRISSDDLKIFQILKDRSSLVNKAFKALKGRNTAADIDSDHLSRYTSSYTLM